MLLAYYHSATYTGNMNMEMEKNTSYRGVDSGYSPCAENDQNETTAVEEFYRNVIPAMHMTAALMNYCLDIVWYTHYAHYTTHRTHIHVNTNTPYQHQRTFSILTPLVMLPPY